MTRTRLLTTLAGTALLSCTWLVGCGGSSHGDSETVHLDGGVDLDATGGGSHTDGTSAPVSTHGYDALPPPPQVVNSDGGILTSPVLVAVFFSNDDPTLLASFEQFYTGLGTSTFWQAATEYGIGPATAQNVVLPEAAPATIDDTQDQSGDNTALETWLLNEISSHALPAPTANTVYVLNYPSTTTVTANGTACTDFDGYHEDLQDSAGDLLSYAVIPRCTDMGSTLAATFTATVSHEALEAATDPYPDYEPGWGQCDIPHLFFDEANDGSEIADMCENDPEAEYTFSDFPFVVQRYWSNKSALAGHDPCVPALPNKAFFNAVPELPDTGLFDYFGSNVQVSSVNIPLGSSKTVYLDLYSDGAMADWDVNVLDYYYAFGGAATEADGLLTIEQSATKGNDGTRLPVTITVKTAGNPDTNGQVANTELFLIVSSQGTSQTAPAHYWYGLVTN